MPHYPGGFVSFWDSYSATNMPFAKANSYDLALKMCYEYLTPPEYEHLRERSLATNIKSSPRISDLGAEKTNSLLVLTTGNEIIG